MHLRPLEQRLQRGQEPSTTPGTDQAADKRREASRLRMRTEPARPANTGRAEARRLEDEANRSSQEANRDRQREMDRINREAAPLIRERDATVQEGQRLQFSYANLVAQALEALPGRGGRSPRQGRAADAQQGPAAETGPGADRGLPAERRAGGAGDPGCDRPPRGAGGLLPAGRGRVHRAGRRDRPAPARGRDAREEAPRAPVLLGTGGLGSGSGTAPGESRRGPAGGPGRRLGVGQRPGRTDPGGGGPPGHRFSARSAREFVRQVSDLRRLADEILRDNRPWPRTSRSATAWRRSIGSAGTGSDWGRSPGSRSASRNSRRWRR